MKTDTLKQMVDLRQLQPSPQKNSFAIIDEDKELQKAFFAENADTPWYPNRFALHHNGQVYLVEIKEDRTIDTTRLLSY